MPERVFLDLENLRRLTRSLVVYSLLIVMELVDVEPEAAILVSVMGIFVFGATTAPEPGWVEAEGLTEGAALLTAGDVTSGFLTLLEEAGVRAFRDSVVVMEVFRPSLLVQLSVLLLFWQEEFED